MILIFVPTPLYRQGHYIVQHDLKSWYVKPSATQCNTDLVYADDHLTHTIATMADLFAARVVVRRDLTILKALNMGVPLRLLQSDILPKP